MSALRTKVALAALILVSTLTASLTQPAGRLSMTVTCVRNSAGGVRRALFNSPAAFPFGKPTQGYGFSNNATDSFGPPNFSAAAFRYDGGNMVLQGSLTY